jgi:hypothetical protein
MAPPRPDERFRFAFDAPFRPLLAALGVFESNAFVELTSDEVFVARFGPWTCATPLANVAEACVTGPYRWWRAIGTRLSLADGGATFGSSTAGGTCLRFVEPVRALDPAGLFRHPGLTVTVADPEALAERVRARAGLPDPRP